MPKVVMRKAKHSDLEAITEIYNDAILKTTATFDTQTKSMEEQEKWFAAHDEKHPIIVAEISGKVVGWASLSRWSDRCAYSGTAENSVYVAEKNRGMGIGNALLEKLMEEGKKCGLHTVIARIASGNGVSVKMHEKAGFSHIGTMKEVGVKFGKLLDVIMMQKIYD
ncbi:MAG: GNAT family N-acetyltransferase [Candidatus Thermoplasmatota archaeon]|nr:GNAT family N-acetyltransferase [Candidatus Thermoplasmatota archaeon]